MGNNYGLHRHQKMNLKRKPVKQRAQEVDVATLRLRRKKDPQRSTLNCVLVRSTWREKWLASLLRWFLSLQEGPFRPPQGMQILTLFVSDAATLPSLFNSKPRRSDVMDFAIHSSVCVCVTIIYLQRLNKHFVFHSWSIIAPFSPSQFYFSIKYIYFSRNRTKIYFSSIKLIILPLAVLFFIFNLFSSSHFCLLRSLLFLVVQECKVTSTFP